MDTITCPLVSLELRVKQKLTISFIRLGYPKPELELELNFLISKIGLRLNPGFYVFVEPKLDPFNFFFLQKLNCPTLVYGRVG
jgi:hypothetical protein